MKKKLFIGFASVAAVGTFWACGDGTINEWDEQDEITKASFIRADGDTTDLASMRKAAFSDCMANPDCEAKYHDYLLDPTAYSSAEDQPVSSATGPTSSMSFPMSSSSINRTTKQSSSSRNIIDPGSSSAETVPVTGLGSCAPTKSPIDKGGSVTWDFTPNLASGTGMNEFIQASYTWNFGDDGTGTGMTSTAVSYTTPGSKAASVTVTIGLKSETVACKPLQVNGTPITGCTCEPTNIQPDVNAGESATWTAKGCTSSGATITGYTWIGATADASGLIATAPVAAKGDVVSGVSFIAENDDSTKVTITCDDAKAIDKSIPDYIIDGTADGTYTGIGPGDYTMVYACKTDQYYQTPLMVVAPDGPVTGSVNGTAFEVSQYGQEMVFSSQTANTSIAVKITSGSATIKCQ